MGTKQPRAATGTGTSRDCRGLHDWRYETRGDPCAIMASAKESNAWEMVALTFPTSSASAEETARFIVGLLNDAQSEDSAAKAALRALEAVIEEGLTWSTEQEAEHAIERLKGRGH